MPRRKNPGIAISSLQEALQTMPVRQAVGMVDRRSLPREKRLIRELEGEYKPSQIAEEIGISTQKYVALRHAIREEEISSGVMGDFLENVLTKLEKWNELPIALTGKYKSAKPVEGRVFFPIEYIQAGENFVKNEMKWAENVQPGGFASLRSALNWYGEVTGGQEYFWIVRDKRGQYSIYDVRTAAEKANKGNVKGKSAAQKIFERKGRTNNGH